MSNHRKKQQSTTLPLPLQTTLLLQHPNDVELNSRLQQSVEDLHDAEMCKNTQKAMEPKEKEYAHFCDVVYPNDLHRRTLAFEKVYRFMWFQSSVKEDPGVGTTR